MNPNNVLRDKCFREMAKLQAKGASPRKNDIYHVRGLKARRYFSHDGIGLTALILLYANHLGLTGPGWYGVGPLAL